MKVLGLSPLDKDSTVSIVEDGRIIYAAGEERFSRTKQQDGFPAKAIENALAYTGTEINEFDLVSYPFLTWESESKLFSKNLSEELPVINGFDNPRLLSQLKAAQATVPDRVEGIHGLKNPNEKIAKPLPYETFYRFAGGSRLISRRAARRASLAWRDAADQSFKHWQQDLEQGLSKLGLSDKLKRMEHHQSHAANSFTPVALSVHCA